MRDAVWEDGPDGYQCVKGKPAQSMRLGGETTRRQMVIMSIQWLTQFSVTGVYRHQCRALVERRGSVGKLKFLSDPAHFGAEVGPLWIILTRRLFIELTSALMTGSPVFLQPTMSEPKKRLWERSEIQPWRKPRLICNKEPHTHSVTAELEVGPGPCLLPTLLR